MTTPASSSHAIKAVGRPLISILWLIDASQVPVEVPPPPIGAQERKDGRRVDQLRSRLAVQMCEECIGIAQAADGILRDSGLNGSRIGGRSARREHSGSVADPAGQRPLQTASIQSSFTGFLQGRVVLFDRKSKENQGAINRLFGKDMTLGDLKTGDPNGYDVPHWVQVDDESGGLLLRFHEGEAEMRTSTSYPTRDAYLRRKVPDGIGSPGGCCRQSASGSSPGGRFYTS